MIKIMDLKMLSNMKVTVMPFVAGGLRLVPKELEKRFGELEIRGRIETLQTTVLLKSAKILRRVLDIGRDLSSLRLH